jgi:hypothetical protein
MRAIGTIIAFSFFALILGAIVLGGFLAGPIGILGGPLLALFGWFYFPPIVLFVSLGWIIAGQAECQDRGK